MAKSKNFSTISTQLPSSEKMKFSFEYYDNTSEFCLSSWEKSEIKQALIRLQDICTKSYNELRRERFVYHFGEVIWERTTKPIGFPIKAVNGLPAFHFALLGVNGQKARVYGAYSTGTFILFGLI